MFPTQSTKINKQVVKLVPKNGSEFTSSQIMRIEFPSDNYLNVLNSVLQFDVSIQRAPIYVSPILDASQMSGTNFTNGTYGVFALNNDMVVSWICSQSAGSTFTINLAQVGTNPAALNTGAWDGCVLTVHRGGLTYSAVIQQSCVTSKVATNTYYTQILYLATPLSCCLLYTSPSPRD